MTDRLNQKTELLIMLGGLITPLLRLPAVDDTPSGQRTARTLARYNFEFPSLVAAFEAYSLGEPGHNYSNELNAFRSALMRLSMPDFHTPDIPTAARQYLDAAVAALHAIPLAPTAELLEAQSPFTAYCRLRELTGTLATQCVTWVDPYFGPDIFFRYLRHLDSGVHVHLLAAEPGARAGKANRTRWESFLDASRLYAAERPTTYALSIAASLHDRWLVIDDSIAYSLGGSAKDAAATDLLTIAPLGSDEAVLSSIRDLIANGDDWFGASQQVHR